jgi:MoaA/NifB/PqqE/SkfB family radical SAM enzyme
MNLKGLHLLLTYRCNYVCNHCFVWSGPRAAARTMTLDEIDGILRQGLELGSVDQIYFEGGEPFLHPSLLADAVKHAVDAGLRAGVVSNGFWASSAAKARRWLQPLLEAGLSELFLSKDELHGDAEAARRVDIAVDVAQVLALSTVVMVTARPNSRTTGSVMFRGRAAVCLATDAPCQPWQTFTACPYENLADPSRVHVDPFGYVHLCQGIVMGNLFEWPLVDLVAAYAPQQHPIAGPLLQGGPAALVARYALPHDAQYVDACHLCYTARLRLRPRFPELLAPGQVYGEMM